MRFLTAGMLAAALSLAGGAAAGAQTCLGYSSFANGRTRVNGDLSIADHATTYGGGFVFAANHPTLFGGIGISGTRFDGTDETAKNLEFSAGLRVPLVSLPGTEVCPVVDFVHSWGPDVPGSNISSNTTSLGGAIGHPFAASPTLGIVPFADLRWIHGSVTTTNPVANFKSSDNFGSLTLGAGIVFNKTVTVRPGVAIPIDEDRASSVFVISIAFNLGSK